MITTRVMIGRYIFDVSSIKGRMKIIGMMSLDSPYVDPSGATQSAAYRKAYGEFKRNMLPTSGKRKSKPKSNQLLLPFS
jgi:hypothetical protein